jgi:hypothetical protein
MNVNWDSINAFCTGLAAIATAAMAVLTWKTIWESRKQHRKLWEQGAQAQASSERHHQDAFRPIVVITPYDGVDPHDRSSLLEFDPNNQQGNARLVRIHGLLKNIGPGTAVSIKLQLRFMGIAGYGSAHEISPLEAGEVRGEIDSPIQFQFPLTDTFNAADAASAGGMLWELVIEYEDVFGSVFHTVHAKSQMKPWTTIGRGPEIQEHQIAADAVSSSNEMA